MKKKPELGDLVRDRISRFEGVVIGYTRWLTGCDRVVVQPRELRKEGGLAMTENFDITMVEVVKRGVIRVDEPAQPDEKPGGPQPRVTQERRS